MDVSPLRGFRATQKRWASLRAPASAPLLAGVVLLAAAASPAIAQCQYEVTAIITAPPCPFTGPPPLTGTGMNNAGAVVGYYDACIGSDVFGFYWSEDTGFITLPTPPGVIWVRPQDVNDAGLICGSMTMNGVNDLGFTYDINGHPGVYTFLPPLNGSSGASWANAINNNGVVAGARSIGTSGVSPYNAVIWDTTTGEVTDLGVMQGPNSSAVAIAADGSAAGWCGLLSTDAIGFLYADRELTVFGPVDGGVTSFVRGMNDLRTVVGSGRLPNDRGGTDPQSFVWDDGHFEVLPGIPPHLKTTAAAIALGGQVVGTGTNVNNSSDRRAMVWTHEAVADLTGLVTEIGSASLSTAITINTSGTILTSAQAGNTTSAIVVHPVGRPPTDLTGDCQTGVRDLLLLLELWGSNHPSIDFNSDAKIDVSDLLMLLSNWG